MPHSCPSCGAHVNPSDAFCPNCGNTLRTSSQRTVPIQPVTAQGDRQQRPERGYTPPPRQSQQRPWFHKKRFVFPLVFLMLMGITGAAGLWYVSNTLDSFNDLSTPPPNADGEQPPSLRVLEQVEAGLAAELGLEDVRDSGDNAVTLLLMGVDARPGESIDIGVRPDSLSVLHISGDGSTCRTLSIPRDTATYLPGYGQSKINHALSVGGVPYQELVVEQFIGVEIDHFALIDFAGMAEVIDAIGGVTVTNPTELTYEGVTVPPGEPTLNGEQALVFARFRDDAEGDFGRQRRQQALLQAVLQQTGGLDVARMMPSLLGNLDGHFKTDLKVTSLISLMSDALLNCGTGELETASIDGTVGSAWDDLEGMELSFVQVPETEIAAKTSWLLGETSATSLPAIARSTDRRTDVFSL